jgi:hypothetical protein
VGCLEHRRRQEKGEGGGSKLHKVHEEDEDLYLFLHSHGVLGSS